MTPKIISILKSSVVMTLLLPNFIISRDEWQKIICFMGIVTTFSKNDSKDEK